MARFAMVDLSAADVFKTIAFYRQLGVDIPREKVWEEDGTAHHVEAPLSGDVVLGINSRELTARYDAAGRGSYLIFTVDTRDDVDAKYGEMTSAGYAGHLEPFDAFWGARYAVVDDPDGNHVGIMSPSDRPHGETSG
jgi:uncharacterized glyoxalase superfamily protein PhnB